MTKRILLTGASGGLGSALYQAWKDKYTVLGLAYQHAAEDQQVIDLVQPLAIAELVKSWQPDLIVHTVGLTDVDRCDREPALAMDINVQTTLNVRLAAEAIGCKVIHISTNDVFGGQTGLYTEQDSPQPINFYSHSKLMAEKMFYGYENSLILRFTILSWYASAKKAFARWLVESLRSGQSVRLFQNQFNSPLYVSTLAEWIEALFEAKGIYHLGSERHSRYASGLALAQAMGLDTSLIIPGRVEDVVFDAPRPLDVSLNCERVNADWGLQTSLEAEIQKMLITCPADLLSGD